MPCIAAVELGVRRAVASRAKGCGARGDVWLAHTQDVVLVRIRDVVMALVQGDVRVHTQDVVLALIRTVVLVHIQDDVLVHVVGVAT
eukprot:522480-Heterocapsa_arctica.AAC.1